MADILMIKCLHVCRHHAASSDTGLIHGGTVLIYICFKTIYKYLVYVKLYHIGHNNGLSQMKERGPVSCCST